MPDVIAPVPVVGVATGVTETVVRESWAPATAEDTGVVGYRPAWGFHSLMRWASWLQRLAIVDSP